MEIVLNQIQKEKFDTLHIVLGVVNDKDLDEILPLFPTNAIYYFCKPNIPRGLEPNLLQDTALKHNLIGDIYASVAAAYNKSKKNATSNDFIFVGGSNFVIAELPINKRI